MARACERGSVVAAAVILWAAAPAVAVAQPAVPEETITLEEIISLPERDLAKVDIAAMNLACAAGLPGSETIDRAALLARLDAMAAHVAYEILRHRYRFEQRPEEYNHSWGEFCMLVLTNILQQDFGIRYNPDQITPVDDPSGFDFSRSQDLFINGLLQGTGGTCTSMPVLYIAVGRRLGFPLKLVDFPQHTFVRWDDPATREKFNIEATAPGYASEPDAYYEEWLRPLRPAEKEHGNYLASLTPREELSMFLTTRGDNLCSSGRLVDANRAYRWAVELAPRNYAANVLHARTTRMLEDLRAEAQIEAVLRRQDQRLRTDPRVMIPGLPGPPRATPWSVRPVAPTGPVLERSSPTRPRIPPRPGQVLGRAPGPAAPGPSGLDSLQQTRRHNQELLREAREWIRQRPSRAERTVPPSSPSTEPGAQS